MWERAMRLFTGLSVPADISARIGNIIDPLRDAEGVRWSPVENLHITTKFIGEWPDAQRTELEAALASIPRPKPFSLDLAGFGYLPNPHAPRALIAGVKGGEALRQLASGTDAALAELGLAPESRAYMPHVTLARLGPAAVPLQQLQQLRQRIAQFSRDGRGFEFGSFTVSAFHLYQSANGAYTKLTTYSFEKAAS